MPYTVSLLLILDPNILLQYDRPMKDYTDALPPGVTLAAFAEDKLIFSAGGAWLHPLFELETFLLTYAGSLKDLSVHDTVAGKAAAALMVRMGVTRVHIDLVSDLAVALYEKHQIALTYGERIEKILCKTEELLASMEDEEAMYQLLSARRTAALAK